MKVLYTYYGVYAMHRVVLTDDTQDALDSGDLEPVLKYCIDTDQIPYTKVDDMEAWTDNYDEMTEAENGTSDTEVYIDNTGSDIPEKRGCYYVSMYNAYINEE